MTAIGSMNETIPTTMIVLILAIILLLTCLLGLMLDTQNIILNQTNANLNKILSIVSKNWLLIHNREDVNTNNSLESISYENELLERQHHNRDDQN